MIRALLLTLALASLASHAHAQHRRHARANPPHLAGVAMQRDSVEACSDTAITGNTGMSRETMLAAERQTSPDPVAREDYRLQMLSERAGAWERESGRAPERLYDFAAPVAEVPWLGTCDPWGHRVVFTRSGDLFHLRSAGPDGRFGTADDLVREGMVAHRRTRGDAALSPDSVAKGGIRP